MTTKPPYTGRAAGGKARSAALSEGRRSEIAQKAAASRWEELPEAVCGSVDRPLVIGDAAIECYVLEDGTRVLSQRGMLGVLGRSRTARRLNSTDADTPLFLQGQALRPFFREGLLERARPIAFRSRGRRALGYNAELLPEVCEVFLAARRGGALPKSQDGIARQAEILLGGLARVGIIALVDEATGYQEQRTRDALTRILADFIDRELQPYLTTFQPDFYRELFRLRGLPFDEQSVKRPQYFGKLTNDIVYDRLAPGVLEELKRVQSKTPAGHPKHKFFQRLTQNVGYPKLREHLGSVVTLMKLSLNWDEFSDNLDRIHPKINTNQVIPGFPPNREKCVPLRPEHVADAAPDRRRRK